MRTWGRIADADGNNTVWVKVETDAQGFNDDVYITTLIQELKLNLGESPFYADHGIPGHPSVVQQVFPDFYVARVQQRFSQYFASLLISRDVSATNPTYKVFITTHQGVVLNLSVAV